MEVKLDYSCAMDITLYMNIIEEEEKVKPTLVKEANPLAKEGEKVSEE